MNLQQEQRDFLAAVNRVISGDPAAGGIGTLGEKTLHAVCKLYMEPDPAYHEIKTGDYVADIARDGLITEIQTRSFSRLRDKLRFYLDSGYVVNVVCPIPAIKWVCWLDPQAGTVSERHKSPKKGTVYSRIRELYTLRQIAGHPNLDFTLLLMEVQDYRSLAAKGRDRKRGSKRYERIPISLIDRITTGSADGFSALIPANLPETFTAKDFAGISGANESQASMTLAFLTHTGQMERIGKSGRAYLYRRIG